MQMKSYADRMHIVCVSWRSHIERISPFFRHAFAMLPNLRQFFRLAQDVHLQPSMGNENASSKIILTKNMSIDVHRSAIYVQITLRLLQVSSDFSALSVCILAKENSKAIAQALLYLQMAQKIYTS